MASRVASVMTDSAAPRLRPDSEWIEALRRNLLAFFRDHARSMPWRETRDPYAIWVSEIMLQQTRVDTVIPYFLAWMERFPTVQALAEADEEEVLKRWEGLGYYSRARNLHRAAAVVRERHGGSVPGDLDALRELPGVGAYTAGAVGSIAFGLRVPAVDGNVRRVAARLLDWPDPTGTALEDVVSAWVPDVEPGDFNQALMELGATVCVPRSPGCEGCPIRDLCGARAAGTVGVRPEPKKRPPVPREVQAVAVVATDGGGKLRLALRRRPPGGLLGGLWEFPAGIVESGEDPAVRAAAAAEPSPAGHRVSVSLGAVPHAFTHRHVTYLPFLMRAAPGAPAPTAAEWLTPEEIRALPLPVAQQSIVESALAALQDLDPTD